MVTILSPYACYGRTAKDNTGGSDPGFADRQAGHARYIQDIQTLTNANFDHDDSINDRVEGGQLENGFFSTTKLWQEVYKHVSPFLYRSI